MSLLLLFHQGSAGGGGGFQAVWALDDEYVVLGNMKKNVASQVIGIQMVSATDGSAFTGAVTCVITKDGGAQSASGGTGPTHEGNGFHTYLPTQAETNADHIGFTFTGTGAIPKTVQVYTTFPQTGDSYIEVTNGTYGLSALETLVDDLETRIGTPSNLGGGATISANLSDIEAQTDDIGVGGAGLTAIPWNASWDAEVQSEVNDGLVAFFVSSAQLVDNIWDEPTTGHVGAGTFGEQLKTDVDAILADTGTDGVIVATNNDKTGYALGVGGIAATAFAAGAITAAALAADAGQEIADEVLDRNLAGGGSGNTRNVRNALRSLRNKQNITGGTLTIYQEDDSTSAWTAAVTTTAGNPISDVDPV